jgi:hypothetical protein
MMRGWQQRLAIWSSGSTASCGTPGTTPLWRTRSIPFFTADAQWLTSAWVLGDLDGLRRQLG